MFQCIEPVTICDQFLFLIAGQPKSKAFGEAFDITFNRLIKYFSVNLV